MVRYFSFMKFWSHEISDTWSFFFLFMKFMIREVLVTWNLFFLEVYDTWSFAHMKIRIHGKFFTCEHFNPWRFWHAHLLKPKLLTPTQEVSDTSHPPASAFEMRATCKRGGASREAPPPRPNRHSFDSHISWFPQLTGGLGRICVSADPRSE